MRYRVGEDPLTAAATGTDAMVLLTAVLGLLIGVVLLWLGVRGRQIWLTVWSGGLVMASLAYLGWELLGGVS